MKPEEIDKYQIDYVIINNERDKYLKKHTQVQT